MPRITEPHFGHLDVDAFAALFPTEEKLRNAIAQLLVRMKREQVTITHGVAEKGKDIIFYANGGFGERRLFACVVKNERITGSVSSTSGASVVIAQVEQCFDIPYTDQNGTSHSIDTVYIISPYSVSPLALESVAGKLRRIGQVEFLCGSRLLDRFQQYYPIFLLEHAGYLDHYLDTLYKALTSSKALSSLFARNPSLGQLPESVVGFYVTPEFEYLLKKYSFSGELELSSSRELDLNSLIAELVSAAHLIATVGQLQKDSKTGNHYEAVAGDLTALINRTIAAPPRPDKDTPESLYGSPQEKRRLRIEGLLRSDHGRAVLRHAQFTLHDAVGYCRALITKANQLTPHDLAATPSEVIRDPRLLEHNLTDCLARVLPSNISIVESVETLIIEAEELHQLTSSVLITAPPGSGKTTFCRWSCWRDILALKQDVDSPIPVYIQLHTVSDLAGDYRHVLFSDPLLTRLLGQDSDGAAPTRRIRLYLDGLDEMPDDAQRKIVNLAYLAANEMSGLQVFVTARDHVSGTHLRWLPRVRISQANDARLLSLASEYYGGDTEVIEQFRIQLETLPAFKEVIRVPLLTLLALAYFRQSRSLPRSKTELYEVFTKLLCGGWDLVKDVRRSCRFGEQSKRDVLTSFAYKLHARKAREGGANTFKKAVEDCVAAYEDVAHEMLEEVIADGILVRSGRSFSFPHLSFQEYFASRALNVPEGQTANEVLVQYLDGNDWWREVLGFYLTSLSNPFRLDWWILNGKGPRKRQDIRGRAEVLFTMLQERFPDKRFDAIDWS